ncbi:MAG: hypothetical protein OXU20_29145 [Myxococcales bacterium]|nr:hypothetical protein [Myxococcales bacterium]MDD9971304.1 hypothetical protein [Myxococcales bacterium]
MRRLNVIVAVLGGVLGAGACLWSVGCEPPATQQSVYDVLVVAESDEGEPLAGLRFFVNQEPAGVTDAAGKLALKLAGTDGQRLPVRALCPEGFDEPTHRRALVLQTFASLGQGGSAHTRVAVTCHAKQRTSVVAVKTGKPDIPIVHRGKVLARTNSSGVAHVQLTMPRDSRFRLKLATDAVPRLRPQNPTRMFEASTEHGWTVWNQPFEKLEEPKPPKPVKRRRRRKKKPAPAAPPTPPPRPPPERLR